MALENTLVPKNWRDRGGGFRQPQEVAAAPAPADTGDTGMRAIGFRNTGGIRAAAQREGSLAAGAASVGEPTSFRGGEGAPEPIAVMRGTATTFSPGRLPGRQFAEPEMATPLQAQQVWNRGMRGETVTANEARGVTTPEATLDTQYGSFREPGQTGKEIAATKEGPGKTAQGVGVGAYYGALAKGAEAGVEKVEGKKHVEAFTDLYENRFGPPPKVGTTGFEDYHDALVHAKQHGDKAGVDRYLETHAMRQVEPLFTPDNLAALRGTPQQQNNPDLSEAAWNFVQQNPQAKREYMLKYGPMLQQLRPPQPPQSVGQRLWSEQAPGEVGP